MALKTTSRFAGAGHYRRFKGYDYSRGAALFITFAVAGRAKVFGAVDSEGRLLHSAAGLAALSTLAIEERRRDAIIVEKSVIMAVPDQLALVYRPKGDEPRQFAEGRLLLLSRVAAPGVSRYDAWHGINAALAGFATAAPGGLSLYATSATDFRFGQCASA